MTIPKALIYIRIFLPSPHLELGPLVILVMKLLLLDVVPDALDYLGPARALDTKQYSLTEFIRDRCG